MFGWDTHALSDTPEFRYTILRHGEDWLAGIMDASGFLLDGPGTAITKLGVRNRIEAARLGRDRGWL